MKSFILIVSCLVLFQLAKGQDKMTNQTVAHLVELGFEDNIVISKINASVTQFDTSVDSLIKLKERGVSSDIIASMIDKSKADIETGIFFYINHNLKKLNPSVFSGTKSSALASALTYGLASKTIKSYLVGARSKNLVDPFNIQFIFQFDVQDKDPHGAGAEWWFKIASTPNEFVLVRMTQRIPKDLREITIGKSNDISKSSQSGVGTHLTYPFSFKKIGLARYQVVPNKTLPPGEYCFFYMGHIPQGGYNNQSVFDFSIP